MRKTTERRQGFDNVKRMKNLRLRWRDVLLVNNPFHCINSTLRSPFSGFKYIKILWIGKMLFHQASLITQFSFFPPLPPRLPCRCARLGHAVGIILNCWAVPCGWKFSFGLKCNNRKRIPELWLVFLSSWQFATFSELLEILTRGLLAATSQNQYL